MIHFYVPVNQANGIKNYLDAHAAMHEHIRVEHYEDLARQKQFPRGTYVLSALDQLSRPIANLLFELHEQLKDVEGVRFLNHPAKTLQRFELLTELNLRGMNDFRAVRAGDDLNNLRFPVFLRSERLHDGPISALLGSVSEIQRAIGRALIQGHELSDLLVVEFCATANETGFYRKYAAFIVGNRVIPRSLNYGTNWMLKHSETEFTMPMVLEELDYVSQNPHQEQLSEIFGVAQVQYGRIDYAIKDARIQTWEINLNPTIGRGLRPPSKPIAADLDAIRDQVRSRFYEGFISAWKEVNLTSESQPPIDVNIDPRFIAAARANVVRQHNLLNGIRTILRPAKSLIEPLTPPFLHVVGWSARLSRRLKSSQNR